MNRIGSNVKRVTESVNEFRRLLKNARRDLRKAEDNLKSCRADIRAFMDNKKNVRDRIIRQARKSYQEEIRQRGADIFRRKTGKKKLVADAKKHVKNMEVSLKDAKQREKETLERLKKLRKPMKTGLFTKIKRYVPIKKGSSMRKRLSRKAANVIRRFT
jgi:pimeloyl-CoA synthetase